MDLTKQPSKHLKTPRNKQNAQLLSKIWQLKNGSVDEVLGAGNQKDKR